MVAVDVLRNPPSIILKAEVLIDCMWNKREREESIRTAGFSVWGINWNGEGNRRGQLWNVNLGMLIRFIRHTLNRKVIHLIEFRLVLITGKAIVDVLIKNALKALELNQLTDRMSVFGFKWVDKWEWFRKRVYSKYVLNVTIFIFLEDSIISIFLLFTKFIYMNKLGFVEERIEKVFQMLSGKGTNNRIVWGQFYTLLSGNEAAGMNVCAIDMQSRQFNWICN